MLAFRFISFVVFVFGVFGVEEKCPTKCSCKATDPQGGFFKMSCVQTEKIRHLDELNLLNLANELIQLNLSGNGLSSFSPKVELIVLQKLDLSRNELTELKAGQFNEVPNLKKLDLSQNNIKYIDLLAFDHLYHLEKLKLNRNQIGAIMTGTFVPLENIKQLDISMNPLVCDCGLLWLLDWIETHSVKLLSNPKCASPSTFEGRSLRKLRVGDDIHCKSPAGNAGLSYIELKPDESQVVFEGDSLTIQCHIPSISDSMEDTTIRWNWLQVDAESHFSDIRVENELLGSAGRISSTLFLPKLSEYHTGTWNCESSSIRSNSSDRSKSISVIVITNTTRFCPISTTKTNKGTYNWPRTVVNHTVDLPCESPNLNYDVSQQRASYTCTETGIWAGLNTSTCPYVSDTTRILRQFSEVSESIEESAKHFRNYTWNVSLFADTVDLFYAVSTIESYIDLAPEGRERSVAGILMEAIDRLMELPGEYLRRAEIEFGTSRMLVRVMERIAVVSGHTDFRKNNLAIEVFPVERDSFTGLTCTLFVDPSDRKDSMFSCSSSHQQVALTYLGKVAEASVTVPEHFFLGMNLTGKLSDLLVAVHSSSKLFSIDDARYGKEDVTSSIAGVHLVDVEDSNLTSPIYVMLRTPATRLYEINPFVPVRWDSILENWTSEGCDFSHTVDQHSVFTCTRSGYYGLLQDVTGSDASDSRFESKLPHPAVYLGVFVLFTSLMVVIVTYLLCYSTIQIPKRSKHSLINTWVVICLLGFFYVFGVYQTGDLRVCRVVGVILHYLTLCSLLWTCVGVNCMYKRLSKRVVVAHEEDVDFTVRKPILGLYLVGWGVGLIVCGLSAAININEYASESYCFLKPGPALSALYVPCAVILVVLIIFLLLVRCSIYDDANGGLSEGTQVTEHVDLDLLEPNFSNVGAVDCRSLSSLSELEDPEHSPSAQLKAHWIFLSVYVLCWLGAAFAAESPFGLFHFERELFSVIFALSATTLSAFTLFFYCVARSDVRVQWVVLTRWLKRKRLEFESRNVEPRQFTVENRIAGSNSSRTSNSRQSNLLKGAVGLNLNGSLSDNRDAKANAVNLVVLHRAQYLIPNIIENPTNPEVFYNPYQSVVARKFFKRQKKRKNAIRGVNDAGKSSESRTNGFRTNVQTDRPRKSHRVDSISIDPDANEDNPLPARLGRERRERDLTCSSEQDDTGSESNKREGVVEGLRSIRRDNSPLSVLADRNSDCVYGNSVKTLSALGAESDKVAAEMAAELDDEGGSWRAGVGDGQSNMSVSDLDELYRQIRRGRSESRPCRRKCPDYESSCLSDSEVNSFVGVGGRRKGEIDRLSDDLDTRV
ncbi:unnamed protein product [Phyllotreta striolata]|uniref:Uncharacterized protein n=1 Tax=Phyllotreta striolata TaxID=444603 RepID=A0A9N9XQI8_PHYSR|nr:unnamed protein product [Phyllotreta striolata]